MSGDSMRGWHRYRYDFLDLQVAPNCDRHGEKCAHDRRIKLASSAALDLLTGCFNGLRCTIGPVVCDGIQRVRYGYDPCSRRYFVAFQTTWIAGPVESLMVRINNFADVFKERN